MQQWNNDVEWKKSDQKKSIHHMIPLWNSRKCGGGGQGEGRENKGVREELQRNTRKLLVVKDMFISLIAVTVSWEYKDVKVHQIVYFRYVQFTVHQLYLNKAINTQKTSSLYIYILAVGRIIY